MTARPVGTVTFMFFFNSPGMTLADITPGHGNSSSESPSK